MDITGMFALLLTSSAAAAQDCTDSYPPQGILDEEITRLTIHVQAVDPRFSRRKRPPFSSRGARRIVRRVLDGASQ